MAVAQLKSYVALIIGMAYKHNFCTIIDMIVNIKENIYLLIDPHSDQLTIATTMTQGATDDDNNNKYELRTHICFSTAPPEICKKRKENIQMLSCVCVCMRAVLHGALCES